MIWIVRKAVAPANLHSELSRSLRQCFEEIPGCIRMIATSCPRSTSDLWIKTQWESLHHYEATLAAQHRCDGCALVKQLVDHFGEPLLLQGADDAALTTR